MVFGEPFRTLIANSDAATVRVFNSKDKEPFAHGVANDLPPGVVSIGDSNHAVTLFAGSGANMALLDSVFAPITLSTMRWTLTTSAAYPALVTLLRNLHLAIAVALLALL